MVQNRNQRRISVPGIAMMALGLGLVIFEMKAGWIYLQLGVSGRVAGIVCGTGFSVWGLKDLIAGLFPSWTRSSDTFYLPMEGASYLVIMCILFIGSLLGRSNTLMMVFACLAGPFVMNGWFTFTMLRRLRVSRLLPERVMAGETFTISLTLENRKSWLSIWLMRVLDSISKGERGFHPEVLFVRVPPRSHRQGHYQLRLHHRGRYQIGPVTVTTRFPLGLVQRGTRLDAKDELLVYPRIGSLQPQWRRLMRHSQELVSDVPTQSGPYHDEISRIREFRHGDDLRMIHWKTTARTNELMVREYEESRDRDLWLVIDGWLESSADQQSVENFERGLKFATTVCMDHLRGSRESSLRVRFAGLETVDWRGDLGELHVDNLLDTFAEIEGTPDVDAGQLFQGIDEFSVSHFRVVVVTGRAREVSERILCNNETGILDVQVFGTSSQELAPIFKEM